MRTKSSGNEICIFARVQSAGAARLFFSAFAEVRWNASQLTRHATCPDQRAAIAANQFGPLAYVSINGRIDSERHEPIFAFQPSVIFPSEETLLPETSAS